GAFVQGGRLVLEDAPHDAWFGFAWLPDGRVATLAFGLDEEGRRETATFHEPRRLGVRVVDEAGTPVPRLSLRLAREGVRGSDEVVTDAEGRASIASPFSAEDAGVELGMVVDGTELVSLEKVGAAATVEVVLPSVRR